MLLSRVTGLPPSFTPQLTGRLPAPLMPTGNLVPIWMESGAVTVRAALKMMVILWLAVAVLPLLSRRVAVRVYSPGSGKITVPPSLSRVERSIRQAAPSF